MDVRAQGIPWMVISTYSLWVRASSLIRPIFAGSCHPHISQSLRQCGTRRLARIVGMVSTHLRGDDNARGRSGLEYHSLKGVKAANSAHESRQAGTDAHAWMGEE